MIWQQQYRLMWVDFYPIKINRMEVAPNYIMDILAKKAGDQKVFLRPNHAHGQDKEKREVRYILLVRVCDACVLRGHL
jgi:hypothetical protein